MKLQLRGVIAVVTSFFCFIALAAAEGGANGDTAPSFDAMSPSLVNTAYDRIQDEYKMPTNWKGDATVEVYIISDMVVNVGNVTGPALYNTVWQSLEDLCPVSIGGNDHKSCWGGFLPFPVRYLGSGKIQDSLNQVNVMSSHYEDLQTRNLLFGVVAGAYQAMSETQRNCYTVNDDSVDYRYCNVALKVGAYTPDSHMYVLLTSDIRDDDDGTFHCCESREAIDGKVDGLMAEMKSVYPTTYERFRNVQCHLGCSDDQQEDNVDVDWMLAEMIRQDW